MDEPIRSPVDWRDVAAAVPGEVAIQVGGAFVHVSEGFASAVGADADDLVDEPWRTPFGEREADRIERDALEAVRTDGRWEGEAHLGGDGQPVDLTLSTAESGAVVWVLSGRDDRDRRNGTPPGESPESGGDSRSAPESGPGFPRRILDVLDDVVYVIDGDGESYLWNEALVETTGYSHEEIEDMHPRELVPEDQHQYVPGLMEAIEATEDRRVEVDVLTADGERIPHEFRGTTFEDPATGESFRCGVARDVTDRRERERELERQHDELATLDSINELLLETVRRLVQTNSRDAVERTVCERLAASELYEFAWVGDRAFDGDRIVPRASAGEDRGYLEAVTITADGSETGTGPGGRAMRTGEVQVARVDDPSFEPWREAASARDFESVAAVPLHHDGTVYGVLVVYSARERAFSPREQAGFDVLGRTVGFVIHAARSRELLFADEVVELEFRVTGTDSALVGVAADLDCELSLDGYVPAGERWILYLSVAGESPDRVAAVAAEEAGIERARTVGGEGTDGRIELGVAESSLLHAVMGAGATVRAASAGPDDARIVVEAPVDADVRGIVERVREVLPDAELLARHDRDREVTTVGRPGGLLDGLTDRQREALEAAYRAGYFEWPRESTAEEVAESLDLTAPTLHGHLRKAEAAVLSALLDGDGTDVHPDT